MSLVANHEGVGLGTIRAGYKDRNLQFDLKRYFSITAQGCEYLRLRDELAEDGWPDGRSRAWARRHAGRVMAALS